MRRHRAACCLMVGALAVDPEPPTPAAPAAPAMRILPQRVRGLDACRGCSGFGCIRDSFATPCTRCRGTGRDPEFAAA